MKEFKLTLEDIKNMCVELSAKGFISLDTRFFDIPFGEIISDSLDDFEIKAKPEPKLAPETEPVIKKKKKWGK